MCTISLSYDPNDAVARQKLAELLETGLFKLAETSSDLELQELEQRMSAYERGEMDTLPQEEIYHRVISTI